MNPDNLHGSSAPLPPRDGAPLLAQAIEAGSGCLRLLVQDLHSSDMDKLEAFMRIGKTHLRFPWEIVAHGEAHILMFGNDEPDTVLGILENPLCATQVSDGADEGPAGFRKLTRPLQYESVVQLLVDVETLFSPDAVSLVSAPRPAAAELGLGVPTPIGEDKRVRLRRWPGSDLLQRSRDYRRMASFLAGRPITVAQLSTLSGVSRSSRDEFISALRAADMLVVLPGVAPDAPVRATAPANSAALQPTGPVVSRGLLGRIRQKLGLSSRS